MTDPWWNEPDPIKLVAKQAELLVAEHGYEPYRALETAWKFWSRVDRTGACWPWTAGIDNWGYGRFRLTKAKGHRSQQFVMKYVLGKDVDGCNTCHRCGSPSCCTRSTCSEARGKRTCKT